MSTYRIITSEGKKFEVQAASAAAAVEEGRWTCRGQTIKEVYSGLKQEDCDFLRRIDRDARPIVGFIIHEVPPHDPISPTEERYKKVRASEIIDQTVPMFDEESIRRESAMAKKQTQQHLMSDEITTLEEYQKRWDSSRSPVMNEVLDYAYEKLGNKAVNDLMAKVAASMSAFTGVEVGWCNIKDGYSWQYTDHGIAFFKMRKPRQSTQTE